MRQMNVYRYIRSDGGVSVSLDKPDGACTEMTRVFADEGKMLKLKTGEFVTCVDTDDASGIEEVDGALVNSKIEELTTQLEEAQAALVELAELQAENEDRAEEHEAALIELAALAEGGE